MVHKKYTIKNGKAYGPYLYENKRVNGKVVTRYLGKAEDKKVRRKKTLYGFLLLSFVCLNLMLSFVSAGILEKSGILITGNAIEGNSGDIDNIPVGQINYNRVIFYLIMGIVILTVLVSSILIYRYIKRKMLERRYEKIRPTFKWQQ